MELLLCKVDGRGLLGVGPRPEAALVGGPPLPLEAAQVEEDGAAEAWGERLRGRRS